MSNKIPFLIIATLVLSSCGLKTFTSRSEDPAIENRLQKGGKNTADDAKITTLALSPERRLFVTKLEDGSFCAEYPTETGVNKALSSAFLASLKKEGVGAAEIKAAKNKLEQYEVFNRRSQSIQMFLAASYYVCQLYLNKDISKKGLLASQLYMYEKALESFAIESTAFYESDASKPSDRELTNSEIKLDQIFNIINETGDDSNTDANIIDSSNSANTSTDDPINDQTSTTNDKNTVFNRVLDMVDKEEKNN